MTRAAGMTGRKRPGSSGISPLRGGSFAASFGRGSYVRGGCRARHPRHRPQPVPAVTVPVPRPHEQDQAVTLAPGAPDRRVKVTVTGRNAAHCPGRPLRSQEHPKILSKRSAKTASQKASSGPTLARGDLCRPGGPDGEGQARGQARLARGEPSDCCSNASLPNAGPSQPQEPF
jgi:hypothetical protein